jgi:hypothetical protein
MDSAFLQQLVGRDTRSGFGLERGLFLTVAACLLIFVGIEDRSLLFDNQNYVAYFTTTDWGWVTSLWDNSASPLEFIIRATTEELGWRLWVIFVNLFGLDPDSGVRITVLAINLLVILSISSLRRPFIALALWIIIPAGLGTIGAVQIRQGLAFSVALYFALQFRRPLLGAMIASSIHTTFAILTLLFVISRLLSRKKYLSMAAVCLVAVGLAFLSSFLFDHFGGRRIEEYAGEVSATNHTINFVIVLLMFTPIPLMVVIQRIDQEAENKQRAIAELAKVHLGLITYLIVCYFIFPFGTARISYYAPLLLIALTSEVKLRNAFALWIFAGSLLLVSYDAVKNSDNYFMSTSHS